MGHASITKHKYEERMTSALVCDTTKVLKRVERCVTFNLVYQISDSVSIEMIVIIGSTNVEINF